MGYAHSYADPCGTLQCPGTQPKIDSSGDEYYDLLYTGYEGPTPLLVSDGKRTRDLQIIELLL